MPSATIRSALEKLCPMHGRTTMFQLRLGKCCNIQAFQVQPLWQHRTASHTVKQQVSSQLQFRKIFAIHENTNGLPRLLKSPSLLKSKAHDKVGIATYGLLGSTGAGHY